MMLSTQFYFFTIFLDFNDNNFSFFLLMTNLFLFAKIIIMMMIMVVMMMVMNNWFLECNFTLFSGKNLFSININWINRKSCPQWNHTSNETEEFNWILLWWMSIDLIRSIILDFNNWYFINIICGEITIFLFIVDFNKFFNLHFTKIIRFENDFSKWLIV